MTWCDHPESDLEASALGTIRCRQCKSILNTDAADNGEDSVENVDGSKS